MKINSHLSSKRFRENKYISCFCKVRFDIFIIIAHGISDTSNDWPRIENSLATSDKGSCFKTAVIEAFDHFSGGNFPLWLSHIEAYSKNHKHMIYSSDTHSINITQYVAAGYATLHVWVLNQWIKEVGSWDQASCRVVWMSGHAHIRSLLGYGAISYILQIFEECRGRYFASSSF